MSQSSQTDNPERPEGRTEAEATQQEVQASPDRPDDAQTSEPQTSEPQTTEPQSSDAPEPTAASDAPDTPAPTEGDDLGEAMDRLEEADPGDTQEVLDAGTQVNDRLQERLDDLTSRGSEQRSE